MVLYAVVKLEDTLPAMDVKPIDLMRDMLDGIEVKSSKYGVKKLKISVVGGWQE